MRLKGTDKIKQVERLGVHSFRCDKNMIRKIKSICALLGMSMSSFISEAMRKYANELVKEIPKE